MPGNEGGSIPSLGDRCFQVLQKVLSGCWPKRRAPRDGCCRPRTGFSFDGRLGRGRGAAGRGGNKGDGAQTAPRESKKRVGQDLVAFISKSHLKRNLLRIQNWVLLQPKTQTEGTPQDAGSGWGSAAVSASFTHLKTWRVQACVVYAERGSC